MSNALIAELDADDTSMVQEQAPCLLWLRFGIEGSKCRGIVGGMRSASRGLECTVRLSSWIRFWLFGFCGCMYSSRA